MSVKNNQNTKEDILVTPNAAIELIQQKIALNSNWYLFLGLLLIVLGALALGSSVFTTLISVVILGGYIIAAGGLELIQAFRTKTWGYFFLHLFLGILYFVSGAFIIYNPVINAVFLTLFLAVFFVISGSFRAAYALTAAHAHRMLLLFSGLINILLGVLIYYQWPSSGLWILGAFVGIDLIVTGWTWLFIALSSKRINDKNKEVKKS